MMFKKIINYFDNWLWNNMQAIIIVLMGLVIVAAIGAFISEYSWSQNYSRLMEECLQDGNKEYDCVGKLKRNYR